MRIRTAEDDEALAIAKAHVAADTETYRPIFGPRFEAIDPGGSALRWERALAAKDVLLVAEDEGEIVGLAHAAGDWMSALYLLASHQRRGIGVGLLTALCEAVRGRGLSEIRFQCVVENVGALAFYRAMGARIVGRKQLGEGDKAWDEFVLALSLEAPAAFRRG